MAALACHRRVVPLAKRSMTLAPRVVKSGDGRSLVDTGRQTGGGLANCILGSDQQVHYPPPQVIEHHLLGQIFGARRPQVGCQLGERSLASVEVLAGLVGPAQPALSQRVGERRRSAALDVIRFMDMTLKATPPR